jgi:hypothetical protein
MVLAHLVGTGDPTSGQGDGEGGSSAASRTRLLTALPSGPHGASAAINGASSEASSWPRAAAR